MQAFNKEDEVKSLFPEEKPVTQKSPWSAVLEDVDMGNLFGCHNLAVRYYFTPGFNQPTPVGEGTAYPWIPPEIQIIWVRLKNETGVKVTGYVEDEDVLHNLIIEVNHEGEG